MEEIEHYIKIMQQKRLTYQREVERLDNDCNEHIKLMKELKDLKDEGEQCKKNIIKHLNTITAHKHTIHKVVHSPKDISGLPVPSDYAQDMKTMFSDAINFLNNIGDGYKELDNIQNNTEPLKVIQDVTTCTETVGKELYQTRYRIAQLETLKENVAVLQQHVSNSSDASETINETVNDESTLELL